MKLGRIHDFLLLPHNFFFLTSTQSRKVVAIIAILSKMPPLDRGKAVGREKTF